jgi:phosphatidate cytidylyltransferase
MSFDAKNLLTRALLTFVGVPTVLWLVLTGGTATAAFALILVAGASWEWVNISGLGRMRALAVLTLIGPLCVLATWWLNFPVWLTPLAAVMVILAIIFTLMGPWDEVGGIYSIGASLFGILYVSLFSLMIPIGRGVGSIGSDDGGKLLALSLIIVWATDILAYLGGSTFGKHPLAPRISPNKSWEGAIFGFIGAILGAAGGWWALDIIAVGLAEITVMGVTIGFISQVGDLGESMLKRDAGVKDSSRILPGHGGVLDRFDSFLFTLVTVWVWLLVRDGIQAAQVTVSLSG